MKFATDRQATEWDATTLAPLVKSIVTQAADYALATWGWELLVTSIFRTPVENAAVEAKTRIHCAWRAIDIRTIDATQEQIDALTAWINDRWQYDPRRPALPVGYSAPHGTGPHLHVQCHANTIEKLPGAVPA